MVNGCAYSFEATLQVLSVVLNQGPPEHPLMMDQLLNVEILPLMQKSLTKLLINLILLLIYIKLLLQLLLLLLLTIPNLDLLKMVKFITPAVFRKIVHRRHKSEKKVIAARI